MNADSVVGCRIRSEVGQMEFSATVEYLVKLSNSKLVWYVHVGDVFQAFCLASPLSYSL